MFSQLFESGQFGTGNRFWWSSYSGQELDLQHVHPSHRPRRCLPVGLLTLITALCFSVRLGVLIHTRDVQPQRCRTSARQQQDQGTHVQVTVATRTKGGLEMMEVMLS